MNDDQLEKYVKAKTDLAEALATLDAIDTYACQSLFGAWRGNVHAMASPILRKHREIRSR